MGTAGFVSALLLWEGILQIAVESSHGMADHPALGKIDRPGITLQTREGFSRTRLNRLGMRSAEPTPKQLGDYRILMLGDSFTRAEEVSDGINFSDRLQAYFSSARASTFASAQTQPVPGNSPPSNSDVNAEVKADVNVEVINAGKPSASPAGYLHAADFHKRTFAPDSTVVQLTEHDFTMDMNNEASEFYLAKDFTPEGELTYQIRHNKAFGSADPLAQIVTEKAPWLTPLMRMSVLRLGGRNLSNALSAADSHSAEAESITPPAEMQRIQAEDAAMVRWSVQQLNQQFPNLVIVFIPAMNYQDAAEVSSDPRNAAIEKALVQATADEGVPLLNMRSDYLEHYRSEGTHLRGFNNTVPGEGHLNSAGHRLIAQRLINFYTQSDSPIKRN